MSVNVVIIFQRRNITDVFTDMTYNSGKEFDWSLIFSAGCFPAHNRMSGRTMMNRFVYIWITTCCYNLQRELTSSIPLVCSEGYLYMDAPPGQAVYRVRREDKAATGPAAGSCATSSRLTEPDRRSSRISLEEVKTSRASAPERTQGRFLASFYNKYKWLIIVQLN